jgi:hypothetical protein
MFIRGSPTLGCAGHWNMAIGTSDSIGTPTAQRMHVATRSQQPVKQARSSNGAAPTHSQQRCSHNGRNRAALRAARNLLVTYRRCRR